MLSSSNALVACQPIASTGDDNLKNGIIIGSFHRIRVSSISWGPHKTTILLYYGRIDRLDWNPHKLQWPSTHGTTPFLQYNTKLGGYCLDPNMLFPMLLNVSAKAYFHSHIDSSGNWCGSTIASPKKLDYFGWSGIERWR